MSWETRTIARLEALLTARAEEIARLKLAVLVEEERRLRGDDGARERAGKRLVAESMAAFEAMRRTG